jgi:hypothetical protein
VVPINIWEDTLEHPGAAEGIRQIGGRSPDRDPAETAL